MVITARKTKENETIFIIFETHNTGRNLADGQHVVAQNIDHANDEIRKSLIFLNELIEKFFDKKENGSMKGMFVDNGPFSKSEKFAIELSNVKFIESPKKFENFAGTIEHWFKRKEGKNCEPLSLEG